MAVTRRRATFPAELTQAFDVAVRATVPGRAAGESAPEQARLKPYTELIGNWVQREHLQLTRIQELLAQQGVPVTYTTLRRFVRQAGLWKPARSTVRMAGTAPGEIAQMDFGRLGVLINPLTSRRQVVWALVVVLAYSRHAFVRPLVLQTLDEVIGGLEMA
jgi:hypothetical protein